MSRLILSVLCLLAACGTSHAGPSSTLAQRIGAAIGAGRYADAITLVRHSDYTAQEKDFSVGELVLQGWADGKAVQRPLESVEQAIDLLEQSAIRGHQQAVAGLAGLFYTGLQNDGDGRDWVAPDPALQACWETTKAKPEQAAYCVTLRRKAANRPDMTK